MSAYSILPIAFNADHPVVSRPNGYGVVGSKLVTGDVNSDCRVIATVLVMFSLRYPRTQE
jgi:hypothetical protein